MKRATSADLDDLVAMMTRFYAEASFTLERDRAAAGFAPLLADDRLGWVWMIESAAQSVGYLVVTRGYSMEYGGPTGVLDDLYVQPAARNAGLASQALAEMRQECAAAGLRAVHVLVGPQNGPAQSVYRRAGFLPFEDRQFLALPLREPTHVI